MIVPYENCQYELASHGRQNTLARPTGLGTQGSQILFSRERSEANLKMVPVGGVPIPWSRLFAFAKV